MEEATQWKTADFRSCSDSTKFAEEMVAAAPFGDLEHAVRSARDIWFNKVDVKGWLEAFAAHPEIGATSKPVSRWSKEEQSTAMATAGGSTMQELLEWNARYMEKFGFVFLICASGRGSPEILAELKEPINFSMVIFFKPSDTDKPRRSARPLRPNPKYFG